MARVTIVKKKEIVNYNRKKRKLYEGCKAILDVRNLPIKEKFCLNNIEIAKKKIANYEFSTTVKYVWLLLGNDESGNSIALQVGEVEGTR